MHLLRQAVVRCNHSERCDTIPFPLRNLIHVFHLSKRDGTLNYYRLDNRRKRHDLAGRRIQSVYVLGYTFRTVEFRSFDRAQNIVQCARLLTFCVGRLVLRLCYLTSEESYGFSERLAVPELVLGWKNPEGITRNNKKFDVECTKYRKV